MRIFSLLLALAGIAWTLYLAVTSIANPAALVPSSSGWLAIATLLITGSAMLNAVIFWFLLNQAANLVVPFRLAARLHLVGQVVRYLPGRFWGLVYQVGESRGLLGAASITRANLDLMLLAVFGNLAVAGVILGFQRFIGVSWAAGIVTMGLGGLLLIRLGVIGRLVKLGIPWLPNQTRLRRFFIALSVERPLSPRIAMMVLGVFLLGWAWYLAGWWALGQAFAILADADFASLSALYTAAWMIGFVSALTPAGLGVREAAFILLAQDGTTTDVATFLALFVRLWLMIPDLLLLPLVLNTEGRRGNRDG